MYVFSFYHIGWEVGLLFSFGSMFWPVEVKINKRETDGGIVCAVGSVFSSRIRSPVCLFSDSGGPFFPSV
jgi:hypothetical protein